MPFTLLSPKALWLALLLLPLVVLYILKVRRKRLAVASTWLWAQARRDLMARSPFKRLLVQWPLVLQALALLALAVAAAQPVSSSHQWLGDHFAIIIDNSASMSATGAAAPAKTTRLALAQQAAHRIIDSLAPGSDAFIIDAASEPRLLLPPDRDRRRLHRAIDALAPRHEEGQLAAAINFASRRLQQSGGHAKMVVISDGNLAHPAPLSQQAIDTEFIVVGAPIDNAAIVRVEVRRGDDAVTQQAQVQAFVSVANFGQTSRELYVTLHKHRQTSPLASRRVVVAAGESLPVVLTFRPQPGDDGQGLRFELSPHDGMPVDDVAFGRVPAARSLPVYLAAATQPSPWLMRALVSDTQANVRSLSVGALADANIGYDALVVVDGACPNGAPGGELLIVDPPFGDCYGAHIGTAIDDALVTSWQQTDSRMRFLTLDGVYISHAHALTPTSHRQALVTSDRGVVAIDASDAHRSITLLGFDVGDSNWPLRASFVLFVRNVLERARNHRSRSAAVSTRAGRPLRVPLPAGVEQVIISGPGDFEARRPVQAGLAILTNISTTGLYRLQWHQPSFGEVWLPVNLTSRNESDLSKALQDSAGPAIDVTPQRQPVVSQRRHSWLLALLALALLLLDIWWLTRKPKPSHSAAALPHRGRSAR